MTFDYAFEKLTGHPPFPWQRRLYDSFENGNIPPSCNLPTGLGKTSVVAIWLIAVANGAKVPRRLAYVVNRRTVVDQTTAEAEKLRENLRKPELTELAERLQGLCAGRYEMPLAISTLRGQFADNREWSADPSRPAVICGTVDMIGSRLLFSGYRIGFRSRPLHAGFLGQDTLLVHDEAHLEPAFQKLIQVIEKEQIRCNDFARLTVMELSATSRGVGDVFELTQGEKDGNVPIVRERLFAKKAVGFKRAERAKVASRIAELALRHKDSDKAVLVFVRTVDDVKTVRSTLMNRKHKVDEKQTQMLTGTLRGLERDRLATEDPVFARFLVEPKAHPMSGTVYLICTSAGEVGIDMSGDHMVCDLTTLDSMAQRFGRVNRRGGGAAEIDVVYEDDPNPKKKDDPFEQARWATLDCLRRLPACDWIDDRLEATPHHIGSLIRQLAEDERRAAFAPEPTILPVTDILFDAWTMTTIRDKMPGRPPVAPYLHGLEGWQQPETQIAWREEVGLLTGTLLEQYPPRDLLDDFPLKPHELLREPSYRALKEIASLARRHPHNPAWLVDEQGTVKILTVAELSDTKRKRQIEGCTILLSPSVGGLSHGMLDGASEQADDVSSGWFDRESQWQPWVDEAERPYRVRLWSDDKQYGHKTKGMRRIRSIAFDSLEDDEDADHRTWDWYELRPLEGGRTAQKAVEFGTHVEDVERWARLIITGLSLPDEIAEAIFLAARLHDHGKKREPFQSALGNRRFDLLLAKSGRKGARLPEPFRHEFASVADAANDADVQRLSSPMQDLVLHLIAAHHGRARPHFPIDETLDPKPATDAEGLAVEIPRRFARLQRQYGRWGLAYLESLLRAADWAASAEPSAYVEDKA